MGSKEEGGEFEYTIPYTYKISRFPVTNAQYNAFVKDGGYYKDRDLWTEAEAAKVWKDGKVKSRWGDAWRERPEDFGEPFNLGNHPAAGIMWYEAQAFCRWLTHWLHKKKKLDANWKIRLPSEPEWEKAARGTDGRAYPWGNDSDPDKANYYDTKIGTTSAVGCFPDGKSFYGAEEMSGNVWEWTRSVHGEYPYPEDRKDKEERENPGASEDTRRVLRGGAFYYGSRGMRCSARYWYYPDGRLRLFGFRVIASPFL